MNEIVYNVSIAVALLMIFGGVGMISVPYAFIVTGSLILLLSIYALRITNVPNKD